MPRGAIAVWELPFVGAEYADLTGDGIVDAADVRAFADLYDLPLLPEFVRKLEVLEAMTPAHR